MEGVCMGRFSDFTHIGIYTNIKQSLALSLFDEILSITAVNKPTYSRFWGDGGCEGGEISQQLETLSIVSECAREPSYNSRISWWKEYSKNRVGTDHNKRLR